MRIFIGMILGVLLTVSSAFVYDTWATGPATETTSTGSPQVEQHRAMVNWDVVGENWRVALQRNARGLDRAVAQGQQLIASSLLRT